MKRNPAVRVGAVLALAAFALASASPVGGVAISGGDSAVRSVGVAVEPDMENLALNLGMANGACRGQALLVQFACSASAAGVAKACAKIEGQAGPGGILHFEADEICAMAGGSVFLALNAGYIVESRHGDAITKGFKDRQVEDGRACTDMQGDGWTVTMCNTSYRTETDVDVTEAHCNERHHWVMEAKDNFTNDPFDVFSWIPQWKSKWCPGSAVLAGTYDCMQAEADSEATSDGYSQDSEAATPSCNGKGKADNTKETAGSAVTLSGTFDGNNLDTDEVMALVDSLIEELPSDVVKEAIQQVLLLLPSGLVEQIREEVEEKLATLESKAPNIVLLSQLEPETQDALRQALSQAFMEQMDAAIGGAESASLTGEPEEGSMESQMWEALRSEAQAAVNEALAEDFEVWLQ